MVIPFDAGSATSLAEALDADRRFVADEASRPDIMIEVLELLFRRSPATPALKAWYA
jgi:hypothetical protein